MQNKTVKNEFGVLPVPLELLAEAGITPYTVIQYSVVNGKLIVEPADTEDYECDGNCEDCPLYDEETESCGEGYDEDNNSGYDDYPSNSGKPAGCVFDGDCGGCRLSDDCDCMKNRFGGCI